MSKKVLIVGEEAVSNQPEEILKTYALGSCIGIIILDPKTRTIGMVHAALPDSSVNPEKAKVKPGYFVNTGIDHLIELMIAAGCSSDTSGLVCKMAGGAAVLGPADVFNVGGRNVEAAKSILSTKGIKIVAEDTGKNFSRTAAVNVGSAKVVLSSPGRPDWTL